LNLIRINKLTNYISTSSFFSKVLVREGHSLSELNHKIYVAFWAIGEEGREEHEGSDDCNDEHVKEEGHHVPEPVVGLRALLHSL
jgi:hypothetical protein